MAVQEQTISAARVWLYVQGVKVGYATNFQATIAFNNAPVDVLGDEFTQEYVLTSVKCAASFAMFVLFNKSLPQVGVIPNTIQTGVPVRFPEKQYDLYDWTEEKVLYRLVGAKPSRATFGVQTGSVMASNVAMDVRKIDTQPE